MRKLAILSLMSLSFGCGGLLDALDTTPARVEVTRPTGPLLDTSPVPLSPRVLTKSGKELPDARGSLAWSTAPPGVASVEGGMLRCLSSGDASVVVTGGGVADTFAVSCRLISKITGPKSVTLLAGEPGASLQIQVYDEKDRPLTDITPEARVADSNVASLTRGALQGLAVGRTEVTVTAGAATLAIPVTVQERITTDTLSLSDGSSVAYTLARGRYSVEINARATDGSGYGVTVFDAGGGCPSQEESTTHAFQCEVGSTTSLVVANPTTFGMGPSAMGNIAIYRVP